MVVQVNGKVRGKIEVDIDITKEEMEKQALNIENVKKSRKLHITDTKRDKHLPDIVTLCKLADILKTSTDNSLGRYTK